MQPQEQKSVHGCTPDRNTTAILATARNHQMCPSHRVFRCTTTADNCTTVGSSSLDQGLFCINSSSLRVCPLLPNFAGRRRRRPASVSCASRTHTPVPAPHPGLEPVQHTPAAPHRQRGKGCTQRCPRWPELLTVLSKLTAGGQQQQQQRSSSKGHHVTHLMLHVAAGVPGPRQDPGWQQCHQRHPVPARQPSRL
jgi:hypothetical protein